MRSLLTPPVLHRSSRDESGPSDIPSSLEHRLFTSAFANQDRFHRASRDGSARLPRSRIPFIEIPRRPSPARDPGARNSAAFRTGSRSTVVRAGAIPATLEAPRPMGVTPPTRHASTASSTSADMRPADGSASSGPLRRWPAFFPPVIGRRGARRRAVLRLFARRKRPAESPRRMAIPFEEMTEPQRLSRRMPDVVTPAPTHGESLDRLDRPDRGLDSLQLATAASRRDPACSIRSDFDAGLSPARLPSAPLSRTWRGRSPLVSG